MIRVIGRKVKFRIKHVTLVGGGPGAPVVGIRFEKDTKGTVRDTIITDIRQTPMGSSTAFIGIHAGVPGGPQVTALTVDSAIISHSQGAGILIEGQGTVGTITYTLIDGGGDRPASAATPVGIIARNGPLVTVHRTDVIDHRAPAGGGEGIGVLLLDAADSSELTYSNVDRNDRGIHLVSTNKMLIFRNALDHSTGDGIVVEEGIDNDVQRNRVASSGGAGIVVVESQRTTVFSNEVTTNGGGGLVLEASSNNTITSNRADTNTGVGMKDDSRGTKTARTANTWKSNVCQGNSVGDSSPVGLCK
jgi:parallel beta-helix repeat protein